MYLPCSRTLSFTDVGIQTFIYFSILRFFPWQGKAIHSPLLLLAFSSSHYKSIPSNQFDLASRSGCGRWTWSFNLGPTLMHMVKVWRIKIITQLLCEMCQVHLFSNTVWIILFCFWQAVWKTAIRTARLRAWGRTACVLTQWRAAIRF